LDLHSLLTAVAICIVSAAIEGLCAGTHVRVFFAMLRAPKYSAPLPIWYAIGVGYYLIFGFILYRLLILRGPTGWVQSALILILVMMLANALWNLIFFRARNLYLAFVVGSAAPVPDVLLFLCLLRLDRIAGLALVPYLAYRAYAVWWGYALWVANR